MDEVRDAIYYPKPFKSSKPTAKDGNGRMTERTFYAENGYLKPIFKWTLTYYAGYADADYGIDIIEL